MHPAEEYARNVVAGTLEAPHVDAASASLAPKYVRKQCAEFLDMWDGNSEKYVIDKGKLARIGNVLSVLVMAKGPRRGRPIAEALAGFQWLIIAALMCAVHRDDRTKRRYETALLEICRKNGKTFIVAVLLILLFYFEPPWSRFFSVAPDGDLAREIKKALDPLISVNEKALQGDLVNRRDWIRSEKMNTEYRPLNYSTNRMDGKEPNVFLADEIGALSTNYPIEAMRSGQLLVRNPLGFCISTKYPTSSNPLEDEVEIAKQVLDGVIDDDRTFSLLYEPDEPDKWMTDDAVMAQGNPLALEIGKVWDALVSKRAKAMANEHLRENFLTKHCNICYQGIGTESYVSIDKLKKCQEANVSPRGERVYVGVDLAMTSDNCAVSLAWRDSEGRLCAKSCAFFPADRIDDKSKLEKVDYRLMTENGWCVPCGDMVVSYADIEEYVSETERREGCEVVKLGFDRYNCRSSAQKWDALGIECIEVQQHSSVLHAPTKLVAEAVEGGTFRFGRNDLLVANFANAKCTYDTNLNRYINKKKSSGKIDMVAALLNAVCLLQQDEIDGEGDFIVQC